MKYDISMLVPGMPFTGESLTTQSLGGSETAGLCMARELARAGHSVKMFCNTDKEASFDGVSYSPSGMWQSYAVNTPHDIAIVQRAPQVFLNRTAARINIAWCHDLAVGRQYAQFASTTWNIDEVFVLSEFMKMQYRSVYDIDDPYVWTTRNGIDLHYFPPPSPSRNPKRLVYSARPERGLDVMLSRVMPALLERDPEIELAIFGYDNPVEHMQRFYGELADLARTFGDRVRHGGTLTKPELYREYAEAGIYVYPTPSPKQLDFAEISCISVMEAMAAGMPVVCSAEGALVETLGLSAGTLVAGSIHNDDAALDVFVNAVLRYANDPERYAAASDAGLAASKSLAWSQVAHEWGEHFDDMFDRLNDDRTRLAHHFYRRSDIFAAKKALYGETSPGAKRLRTKITKEYAFAESDKTLARHYGKNGKATDARLTALGDATAGHFQETSEARFHSFESVLAGKPEVETIYDYGCGHGWCSVYLHNQIGRRWFGVDIDPGAVKWARKFATAHAKRPEDLHFEVIGRNNQVVKRPKWAVGPFDCAIVSEVLEHCIDPFATLTEVERKVKVGGTVIVTVPYGPSEYASANWETFRNHLWEFDVHDLREMFADKRRITIVSNVERLNEQTGEPQGFNLVGYEADHKPIREIDWSRKLRLQRPRQTVSAFLMAGPGAEKTMRWTLDSIKWIIDELVVADCGMSKAGLQACRDYGARVVKSVDPTVNGFEVPRNDGLAACGMDWALWIDTDECLVNPQFLPKYLRQSQFNGFSINQHHFTVEGGFHPDQPVRIFRRDPPGGHAMRFFGMIHEHPETALNDGPGRVLVLPDVQIAHVGYLSEAVRRRRFMRNRPLLLADMERYPTRTLQKHFRMRDNQLMTNYALQANGNVVTEEMRDRARETVELYREFFLGKPIYSHMDPAEYYSQALRVLGEGAEVSFTIDVNRDGVGDAINGGSLRVAGLDEAKVILDARLRQKFDPISKEYW